jgi:hypothetical protein
MRSKYPTSELSQTHGDRWVLNESCICKVRKSESLLRSDFNSNFAVSFGMGVPRSLTLFQWTDVSCDFPCTTQEYARWIFYYGSVYGMYTVCRLVCDASLLLVLHTMAVFWTQRIRRSCKTLAELGALWCLRSQCIHIYVKMLSGVLSAQGSKAANT